MTVELSRRALLARAGLATGAAIMAAPRWTQAAAHQLQAPGGPLRLIANENPYGPSPAARAAADEAVRNGWRYAMRETEELKKHLADHAGVTPDHVMVGAGSAEILRVAALVYARGGGEVIAARPTFAFLPSYARTLGCALIEVPLDEAMRHDLPAMAAAVSEQTQLMYVCNPNNPTGTLITGSALRPFLGEVSARTPVLVDEAYLDLGDDQAQHTAVTNVLAGDRVIVARTFSKLHGMAGLRVGYAIAPPDIIRELEAFRVTQMSLTGVMAATASIMDIEFQAYSRARIREAMSVTTAVLDELGRPFTPSRGNFVLFDTGGSPRDFMNAMRGQGILTGLSFAPYDSWARVSMGRVEDMRTFAAAARAYFSNTT